MTLYTEEGKPELYEGKDIIKISFLVGEIKYTEGFFEAVRWEDSPNKSNSAFAKDLAIKALDLIKQYHEMPAETKNLLGILNGISHLEKMVQNFLVQK